MSVCTIIDGRRPLTRAGYAVSVTAKPDEIAALVRSERPKLVLLALIADILT